LVDSERTTNLVFAEMLDDIGLHFSLHEMFGHSMATCLDIITALRGSPPPTLFLEEYRDRTARALRDRLVAVEGIREAVEMLPIPYCVASSGDHDKIKGRTPRSRWGRGHF
jgi:beta-phosphoglucomutase-like phosphatase (HAD superfamily)